MSVPLPVQLPVGFMASGSTCGIKASGKPDLALFVSDRDATACGVFTTNKVCGAPVIVSKQRVPTTIARAVIINSGNSNAATGDPGIADAKSMTAAVAEQLGCDATSVFVCSTGVIGVPLPMPIILKSDLIDETLEKSRQDNIAHLKQRIEDTRREEEEARREDNTVIVTSLSLKAIERDIYGFFNQVNPDHPVRTHQGYQTDQSPSQLQIQRHRICRVLLPRCTRQRCRDEREGIHGL